MTHEGRADASRRWLLLAGMLAGIAAALAGVMRGEGAGLPDDAVARVNDRVITRAEWGRAVAAVASDRRTPLTAQDRRRILDRLVDEELLVQHGVASGLVREDRRLRGALVSDVMATATSGVGEPDEAALRAWFEAHRDYFSMPGRMRVAVSRADGAAFSPPVPDALLTPAKLQEYVGPRLTEVALALEPGQSAGAAESGVAVRMLEREGARVPPFETVRDAVRDAVLRDREEQAVRALISQLRDEGRVTVREALE